MARLKFSDRYQRELRPEPEAPEVRLRRMLVNLGHTDERICEALKHMKANGFHFGDTVTEIGAMEAYLVLLHKAACRLAERAAAPKAEAIDENRHDTSEELFPR